MSQDTLQKRIDGGRELTEQEQASLVALFGAGCQDKRRRALARFARIVPDVDGFGIYNRVHIEAGDVSYCAGQDYPGEVACVRNLMSKM